MHILLIAQLWVSTLSHLNIYFDENLNTIDIVLIDSELETEKETDNKKKEIEDKIFFSNFFTTIFLDNSSTNFIHNKDLLPIQLIEIKTPPPEQA